MSASRLSNFDNNIRQKYQFLAKIGSGGMGDVFLAIQRGAEDFRRLVVIKRIHDREVPTDYAEEHARMFLNEASVVASLNHPHIVKIYDFCVDGSSFCIVMEYVEGETLKFIFSECVEQGKEFPVGLTCRIIYDACSTLHYAHNSTSTTGVMRRIIHRDIGLHNLMLGSNGYLKVIDFGIAKSSIQTDKTSPGLIKGNPGYMAPELFNRTTQDHRMDIYALGLCLYELLTKTRAFQFAPSATFGDVIQTITTRQLVPPSQLVPDLPEGMDDVVMKAIEKDQDKRYQTVEAFASDLKRVSAEVFMTGNEPQRWFAENFAERLNGRREFGKKILESAKSSDAVTNGAIPKKLPSRVQRVNSVTPLANKRNPATPPPVPKKYRPTNRYKTVSMVLCVGVMVMAAVTLYLLAFQGSSQKEEGTKVMDNLFVSCNPAGSRLSINGKELGLIKNESLTFYVEPKEKHEIVISKEGYRDFTLPFIGPSTGIKRIYATLVKREFEVVGYDAEKIPPNGVLSSKGSDVLPERDSAVQKSRPEPSSEKRSRRRIRKQKSRLSSLRDSNNEEIQMPAKAGNKRRKIPLPDDDKGRKIPVMLD